MFASIENRLRALSKKRSRQGLYEFLSAACADIHANKKVLLVGAGGKINDLITSLAHQQGFSLQTIDITPARKPDIIADICTVAFPEASFDAVICSEVLEHIPTPQSAIDNIHRLLKPGGKLILTVPFIFPMHDEPHDYFRFTRHGLAWLMKNFSIVKIEAQNSYFETIDVLWLRLLFLNNKAARMLGLLLFPCIYFLKCPLTVILKHLVPNHAATTRYAVWAIK